MKAQKRAELFWDVTEQWPGFQTNRNATVAYNSFQMWTLSASSASWADNKPDLIAADNADTLPPGMIKKIDTVESAS